MDPAAAVAAGLERLVRLLRSVTPAHGLSLTAVTTLSDLERSGPRRLTDLAGGEGVTQPAMTQLVARLQAMGLVTRTADPTDGRVVLVSISEEGRAELRRRRDVRADALRGMLAELSETDRRALLDALPVIDKLGRMR
jgi:DNA-binding MarR family transcriptional regulator